MTELRTKRTSESWLQYAEAAVAEERQRCAAIVRAKKRLWWLRDTLELLAKEIERESTDGKP